MWQYNIKITVGSSLSFLLLLPLNGDPDKARPAGCCAEMDSVLDETTSLHVGRRPQGPAYQSHLGRAGQKPTNPALVPDTHYSQVIPSSQWDPLGSMGIPKLPWEVGSETWLFLRVPEM